MTIFLDIFKKKKEETIFDINLKKGLYVGSTIPIQAVRGGREIKQHPLYIPWKDLAGHLVVFGTTRVGKTRMMVAFIRQCILRGMDLLIVEPKGSIGQETLAWILEFLEEAGRLRDFKYISPLYTDLSVKLNPLWGMGNEEIASLIQTLVPGTDDFYKTVGYSVTFAILIGLEFLEKVEGSKFIDKIIMEEYNRVYTGGANIIDAINNVSDPDLATRAVNPSLGKPLGDLDPPYRSLVTFKDIMTYATQEGLNAILSHVSKITVEQFATTDEKEISHLLQLQDNAIKVLATQASQDAGYFSKVANSFKIAIQQLSIGALGEILCSVKINPVMDGFRNPHKGQVLVIQPFPMKFQGASDAFIKTFFTMMTTSFGDVGASGRAFPREIALFIDEGGSVLYDGIENTFNKAGGLGLRIFIFSQSFADYKKTLGPELTQIVNDNTNIKIYMKMNDITSRTDVADSFGGEMKTRSNYMGSKIDMRISAGAQEEAFLTSAHIANLQNQEFILQAAVGSYAGRTPFQPDPYSIVKMPTSDAEKIYEKFGVNFAAHIARVNENQDEITKKD